MIKIAVFDFDKTLFNKDSIIEFTKYIYTQRPYLSFFILIQLFWLLFYWFRIISTKSFQQKFFGYLMFISEKKIKSYIDSFWKIHFPVNFSSKLLERIEQFNTENIITVVVSASPNFLVQPLKNKLSVDYVITTNFELHLKKYLIKGENCRGLEKIKRLKQLFNENDFIILEAYSDNKDDMELLKLANKGFIINKGIMQQI